jgi:hypothetical protein
VALATPATSYYRPPRYQPQGASVTCMQAMWFLALCPGDQSTTHPPPIASEGCRIALNGVATGGDPAVGRRLLPGTFQAPMRGSPCDSCWQRAGIGGEPKSAKPPQTRDAFRRDSSGLARSVSLLGSGRPQRPKTFGEGTRLEGDGRRLVWRIQRRQRTANGKLLNRGWGEFGGRWNDRRLFRWAGSGWHLSKHQRPSSTGLVENIVAG